MVEAMSSALHPPAAAPRQPDLTPGDWLEAGQSLLRRGGLKALKLRPLAEELRVSTGSFYHHFADFDGYQGALAQYFAQDQVTDMVDAIRRATADPVDRIRLLAQTVRRRGMSRLSIAMRAWAESDPRAQAAVERHDDLLMAFLTDCLEQAGFANEEAGVRAYALIALGLGKVHAPHLDMETLMEQLIRILCVPPAK
ncbi:TetR family transcriptional regulator [Sphingomonas sp. EC-HK361]|nr:TetR family transcriptional regulator [Sphingomonas sp. EC-HK361]